MKKRMKPCLASWVPNDPRPLYFGGMFFTPRPINLEPLFFSGQKELWPIPRSMEKSSRSVVTRVMGL